MAYSNKWIAGALGGLIGAAAMFGILLTSVQASEIASDDDFYTLMNELQIVLEEESEATSFVETDSPS